MENLKSQLSFLKEIEIKEIIQEARAQAARLIDDARARAEQTRAKETEDVLKEVRTREEREIESVKAEEKLKIADRKFQLIETALTTTFNRLRGLADKGDLSYKKCLERLVVEAAVKTEGTEFQAIFNPRDMALVRQKLQRMEKAAMDIKGAPVTLNISNEALQSVGGVVLRSKDGAEIFNNTLEARLARVRQEMLVEISEILFEGEDG